MDAGEVERGWQIAEVERLLGLSRRDIQRCCYDGQGGVGLVHPKDSSWGSRTYDEQDLEQLFLVRLQREKGLSLPEVKRVFEAAEASEGGWRAWADDQAARLHEAAQRADELAVCAEALRAAAARDAAGGAAATAGDAEADARAVCGNGEAVAALGAPCALDYVIEDAFLRGLVELRVDTRRAGDTLAVAQADAALAWFAAGGDKRLAGLWTALKGCRARGQAPEGDEARAAMEAALCGSGRTHAGTAGGTVVETSRVSSILTALLDAPGMELALELRLGPGGFDYVQRTLEASGGGPTPR